MINDNYITLIWSKVLGAKIEGASQSMARVLFSI